MRPNVSLFAITFWALCTLRLGLAASPEGSSSKKLTASSIDSGFALSHATFNGMLAASDGRIYYVLCTESIDTGAQMYSYDPVMDKVRHLGDLTEASGEKGLKAVPQGKSHVNFVEWNGKLFFATHIGLHHPERHGEDRRASARIQALSWRSLRRI
jgi:hypothetical protein